MQALMGPSKEQKVVTKKRRQTDYEVCRKEVFGHRRCFYPMMMMRTQIYKEQGERDGA